MSGDLPTIVDGSRIQTVFRRGLFIHRYTVRNGESDSRKEYWKTEKRLGGGAYGTVYLQKCCKGHYTGSDTRALKVIPQDSKGRINWVRELETIMEFSHQTCEEYFVKSLGWFQDGLNTFIVMEYLEHGDLGEYLREKPILPESEARDICYQLICGLRYMHGKNFAHRDLKPGNIMIKAGPPSRWWVKIGDFGLSKRIEETLGISSTVKGTPAFMPPELLDSVSKNKQSIDAKPVDIWSLGEIMFRIITGRPVFDSGRAIWEYADDRQALPIDVLAAQGCTPEGINFFTGMMARRPIDRLTADEGYSHSWIAVLRVDVSPGLSSTDSELPDVDSLNLHEISFTQDSWGYEGDGLPSGEWTQSSVAAPNHQDTKLQPDPLPSALALITVEKRKRQESAYKRHLWTPETKPSEKFNDVLHNVPYLTTRSPSPFQSDASDENGTPLAVLSSGELPSRSYR
ncbi:hypothetical protein AA313_de0208822 [Arthrobotrys entomopaga]|nr:hypothetical protein AA313_de0208822 [Arthrobotrys entomopaga]